MTYPQGLPSSSQPTDIHDATWGVLSAVYGGAVHPSAEGHAAMADAALPAVTSVLQLNTVVPDVTAEPAPPIGRTRADEVRAGGAADYFFFAATGGLTIATGGLVAAAWAAACAGKYLAMIAGSTWAIDVSGSRCQVSSLPNSEMPR